MGSDKIFLDADVIISSLLSKKGASHQIVSNKYVAKNISPFIKEETVRNAKKLHIPPGAQKTVLKNLKTTKVGLDKQALVRNYGKLEPGTRGRSLDWLF